MAQAIFAAYNNDTDPIWITMLVFVIIGAGIGLWSFLKKKSGRLDDQQQDYSYYGPGGGAGHHNWKWQIQEQSENEKSKKHFAVNSSAVTSSDLESPTKKTFVRPKMSSANRKQVDLHGGLELLDLDFLVSIVGNIKNNDSTDVTMHKLSLKELIRRKQLNKVGGKVLKEYAINKNNYYSKDIQCEAIKELALRTEAGFEKNL